MKNSTAVTTTTYDTYKRPNKKTYQIGGQTFSRTFTYEKTRLSYVSDSAGGDASILYDDCGRVRRIIAAGKVTKYYYDQYGQLYREDNEALAKSFVYEYNIHGCLTAIKAYNYTPDTLTGTPVTTTFGYSDDQLTSFGGAAIAYNAIGCPTTYDGKTATWTRGKLSALSKGSRAEGLETYSFSYNAYGQRVSKSYSYLPGTDGPEGIYVDMLLNSSKQFYYDHSGRLIAEVTARTYQSTGAQSERIVFLYDGNTIIGMQHTVGNVTTPYYFHRNPLGDVVGIYNTNGTQIAKYIYDAWGNCTISGNTTVAKANPIRYRGYYYDEETGLYYCNARYYSPKWRRFISPDDTAYLDPSSVNGLNQYCYCGNDPVNRIDPSGYSWESFWSSVGDWFEEHWVEFAIGTAFIIGGAVITALTAGVGTSAWSAFGAALLSSAVQVGGSIAVGVGMNGLNNLANGNCFFDNVGDTIASSYMWGGIFSGSAQMIGGGFRYAANRGVPTGRRGGIKLGNAVKVLSPDGNTWTKAGGTLIKFGSSLRFDIGAMWGLHMHILNWHPHIPIGMVIAGLLGALI